MPPLGRAAVVGEYYVAELPMTLAAVMHFRVAPFTQGQGLGGRNDNSSSTVGGFGDNAGIRSVGNGGGADGVFADGGSADADVVVSSLDLAEYDVLDLPLGGTPHAVYLHSSPLSQVCMTAAAANSKGSSPGNNITPRNLGDIASSSSSLLNGIRFHDRFSRHVEELLGDRYLRAMRGEPPEGDGPEEVDDDE